MLSWGGPERFSENSESLRKLWVFVPERSASDAESYHHGNRLWRPALWQVYLGASAGLPPPEANRPACLFFKNPTDWKQNYFILSGVKEKIS